jgi:DNA repair/transcription protein MET18/MMS19
MGSVHDIPILINQFIVTASSQKENLEESDKYAEELCQLLIDKELSLLQFIRHLGPTLTSDQDTVRATSIKCLYDTLDQLLSKQMTKILSKQDIVVLIEFLVAKFDDKPCFEGVLVSINKLINFSNFLPSLVVTKILNALIDTYNPKQHLAKVRYQGFSCFQQLLSLHEPFFTSDEEYSNLFIRAFVSVAEGEKDPRNLLISFEVNKRINETFSFDPKQDLHKQYINDLFDICFCYFPISFTPPPNDPYKITASQLKDALTKAISSQPLFASELFNSLLEKLTSTNPVVRNDVLKTLLVCLKKYNWSTVQEYYLTIWNSVKFELLHRNENTAVFRPESFELIPKNYIDIDDNDDSKSLILALVIIRTISIKLAEQAGGNVDFLTTVTDELKQSLVKLNDKSRPSVLILAVLAAESNDTFNFIIEKVFSSNVWGKYLNVDQDQDIDNEIDANEDVLLNVEKQRDMVDLLGFFFSSYSERTVDEKFIESNELKELKPNLLVFIGQLFKSSSNMETILKMKIFQQFIKLIQLKGFLNSSELELVFQYFSETLDSDQFKWNDPIIEELVSGLIVISDYDASLIIQHILPNLLSEVERANSTTVNSILHVIQDLCTSYEILEVLSIRFASILQRLSNKSLIQLVMEMFIKLIKKVQVRSQFIMNSWVAKFVPIILKLHQEDAVLVEIIGELTGLIIRFTDVNKHQLIIDQYNKEFHHLLHVANIQIAIYSNVVANVDTSVNAFSDFKLEPFIDLTKSIGDAYLRVNYLQFLSLVVNKFVSVEESLPLLFDKATNGEDLEIYIWVLKGLLLKLDKSGLKSLNELLRLNEETKNHELKCLVSRSFLILFADLPIFVNQVPQIKNRDLVSKVSNYNIKLLYKQHIFEIIFPHLTSGDDKIYLHSLSLILNNLDNQAILKPHSSEILPSMLKSLMSNDSIMIKSSLSTLKIIIEQDPTLIIPHLATIIPILNKLIGGKVVKNHKQVNNESIRVASLQIMSLLFEQIHNTTIIIHKNECLAALGKGLDDPKRSVRKTCADLRQMLFEL